MTDTPVVECVFDARDKLGEAITWDPDSGSLWWVDVPMPSKLRRLNLATGTHESWELPEMAASFAVMDDGRLLVASHHGLNLFDPDDGTLKRVTKPEAAMPGNRSNDGKTDAAGRFWYGSMPNNIAADGAFFDPGLDTGILYRVGPDMVAVPMDGGFGISNATCWSPDSSTMYFADTAKGTIYAYDFDLGLGAISNRRVFAAPDGYGYPDGATVDAEGYLWNARWEGGCVIRFAPDGSIDRVVEMPVERVTCCAFGGPDLDTLYVTTSRLHLTEAELAKQPFAGGILAVKPGVKGMSPHRFSSKRDTLS